MAVAVSCVSTGVALLQAQGKPPEVVPIESIPKETRQAADLRKAIDAEIEAYGAREIEMNDWMYHNPETGYHEDKASAMMGEELKKAGFDVKYGVEGLPKDYKPRSSSQRSISLAKGTQSAYSSLFLTFQICYAAYTETL